MDKRVYGRRLPKRTTRDMLQKRIPIIKELSRACGKVSESTTARSAPFQVEYAIKFAVSPLNKNLPEWLQGLVNALKKSQELQYFKHAARKKTIASQQKCKFVFQIKSIVTSARAKTQIPKRVKVAKRGKPKVMNAPTDRENTIPKTVWHASREKLSNSKRRHQKRKIFRPPSHFHRKSLRSSPHKRFRSESNLTERRSTMPIISDLSIPSDTNVELSSSKKRVHFRRHSPVYRQNSEEMCDCSESTVAPSDKSSASPFSSHHRSDSGIVERASTTIPASRSRFKNSHSIPSRELPMEEGTSRSDSATANAVYRENFDTTGEPGDLANERDSITALAPNSNRSSLSSIYYSAETSDSGPTSKFLENRKNSPDIGSRCPIASIQAHLLETTSGQYSPPDIRIPNIAFNTTIPSRRRKLDGGRITKWARGILPKRKKSSKSMEKLATPADETNTLPDVSDLPADRPDGNVPMPSLLEWVEKLKTPDETNTLPDAPDLPEDRPDGDVPMLSPSEFPDFFALQ